MTVEITCPRCGEAFVGTEAEEVVDAVVAHAASQHRHRLDRHVVIAHLQGVRPDDLDP